MPVRVRGVDPVDETQLAAVAGRGGGGDQLGAADLVVALGAEARDDQLAAVVVDQHAVAVAHHVAGRPAAPLDRRLLGLPEALAGGGVHAAELAVAADAVDVPAVDDRRGQDRVQAIGADLAVARPFPLDARVGPVLVEGQHHRAVVERGEEELRAHLHRHRHGHRPAHDVRLPPIDLAGDRVERGHLLRVPDDELPCAARLDDNRLGHPEILLARQGAPELLAGQLVEGHHPRVGGAADEADEPVAVDQRCAGEAPVEAPPHPVHAVVFAVALPPEELAGVHAQRGERAGAPEDVHPVVIDRRRRSRPYLPLHARVVGGPFLHPEDLAGRFVERQRALGAAHPVRRLPVRGEDPPVGHRRSGESRLDRHPPAHLQSLRRERLYQAGLAPFAEPARATKLRPVVGADVRRTAHERHQAAEHRRLPRLHDVSLAAVSGPPARCRSLRRSPGPAPCRRRRSAPAGRDSRLPPRCSGRPRRTPAPRRENRG